MVVVGRVLVVVLVVVFIELVVVGGYYGFWQVDNVLLGVNETIDVVAGRIQCEFIEVPSAIVSDNVSCPKAFAYSVVSSALIGVALYLSVYTILVIIGAFVLYRSVWKRDAGVFYLYFLFVMVLTYMLGLYLGAAIFNILVDAGAIEPPVVSLNVLVETLVYLGFSLVLVYGLYLLVVSGLVKPQ